MKNTIKEISSCRICSSKNFEFVYSLGEQYINNFINPEDLNNCLKAPLDLVFCNFCKLLQLKHNSPQELLYSRYYWYKSGITNTMKNALKDITLDIEDKFELKNNDVVLDIGSNDGTLLRSYSNSELIKVGVEPATNLAEEGKKNLDVFINDFWDYEIYKLNLKQKAKVITAIGMFYDMEDPNRFILDVSKALSDEGVFVAQLMCLNNMIESSDIGNICHEHLEFYSFASLKFLFENNGLKIFNIISNNVNGGSYRIYAKKITNNSHIINAKNIEDIERKETYLKDSSSLKKFFEKIELNKNKCMKFIEKELENNKKIFVYGASTKGNVILQYFGIDNKMIQYAAEKSPWKWGKYTVGSMIECISEEEARTLNPDYFLVLPYAFIDEFCERERKWRDKGGKFILPIPELKII